MESGSNLLSEREEDAQFEPVVLHIESYEPLHWNEIEQCVIWEVKDTNQNRAFLRLNWQGIENNKIDELRFITQKIGISVQLPYKSIFISSNYT